MNEETMPNPGTVGKQVLTICGWNETFESADTRKRQRLKSFHAPSGCDSRGYLALVSFFDPGEAMQAFGVFQAICQISATFRADIRGTFRNTDGTPMELQQISVLLRIPICHLSASLKILCDERVRWCKWVLENGQSATYLPPICHLSASFVQGEGEGEGEGEDLLIVPDGTGEGNPDFVSAPKAKTNGNHSTPADFTRFWLAYPRKIAKQAALKAWHKAKGKPPIEVLERILAEQRQSHDWTRDNGQFIPHPATWLNGGQWDNEPTPAPRRKFF